MTEDWNLQQERAEHPELFQFETVENSQRGRHKRQRPRAAAKAYKIRAEKRRKRGKR